MYIKLINSLPILIRILQTIFYFTVTVKRMMNRWTKQVHCKGGPNETEGANTFVIGFNKETNEMTLK